MRQLALPLLLLLMSLAHSDRAPGAELEAAGPPRAPVEAKTINAGGERRVDPYYWLRRRDDPRTRAYLEAENAWERQWMSRRQALRETLYQEMLARIRQDDESVPVRRGDWWYSSRTLEGAQYPVYLRRPARGPQRELDPQAPAQTMLDLNAMAAGKPYLSLGSLQVSPDGRWLAYTVDETGGLDYQLRVREIATGTELPFTQPQVSSVAWANDNRTLYWVTMDEAKRSNRLWRRSLGGDAAEPKLLLEERDARFNLGVSRTRDGRYVLAETDSHDSAEARVYDADQPNARARVLLPRRPGIEYSVDHRPGAFYLLINDRSPQYRVVRLPDAAPRMENATTIVPDRDDVAIDGIDAFAHHLVLTERVKGALQLRILDLEADPGGSVSRTLAFDEAAYAVGPGSNPEFDPARLRFEFESMSTPPSEWDVDLNTGERWLLKQTPVDGGYDPTRYESARLLVKVTDGTEVPVSLVWRRDRRRDGPQPLLLYGYGAYGIPTDPWFSSNRASLLDRGVIFAIAHVRGGGDLGRRWYDAGKMAHKMNSFTDLVDCARALVDQRWTQPSMLAIEGGSAGGLLVTAATNLAPELFRAVIAEVPFVDALTTMLDASIPLTAGEYVEWGNPKRREQYAWIRAYSPYDNLRRGPYPAMYVRTGFNDSQVQYWEPAKYVAKMRTLRTDDRPLLLHTDLEFGHGGASGRFDALRERADIDTFLLDQLGVEP